MHTDEELTDSPEPETADEESTLSEATGPNAGEAWRAVLARLDELGEAVGRWAKAAVSDPDNKRRVQEFKEHLDRIGERVGDAIDGASESPAAQNVKEAAGKAGEALKEFGERFGEEVFPRMASAFEGAAKKLHEAAEKVEAKTGPSPEEVEEAKDAYTP